jgi:serralysin
MMSYNDGWQLNPDGLPTDFLGGYEGTLMAFDVALMQQKYGANTSFHNKADTYVLSDANGTGAYYSCLWDTGGTDRILYQGASDATIDLRAAHLGYAAGSGGYISFADGIFGGFTIAHDVVIENARGGSGRDRIIGNDARNFLNGGAGDDTIMGGLGGDTLKGGGGADTFVYVSAEDSSARAQARDQIIGFQTGLDKIDLAAIDARTGGTDNDTFLWIGHRGFHEIAGELRWKAIADGILVVADRDGDGRADFSILLAGLTSIAEVDFLL